jgi:hypothetical protein
MKICERISLKFVRQPTDWCLSVAEMVVRSLSFRDLRRFATSVTWSLCRNLSSISTELFTKYIMSNIIQYVGIQYTIWYTNSRWNEMGNMKRIFNGEVKLSVCLINQAPPYEDVWESGGIAPPFLSSGGELSASHLGCFKTEKRAPRYPLVDLRAGLDAMEKRQISSPSGNRTPAVQPVARRYRREHLGGLIVYEKMLLKCIVT